MGTGHYGAEGRKPGTAARGRRRAVPRASTIPPSPPVLLVEDSQLVAKLVGKSIISALDCPVTIARDYAEASAILADDQSFLAAVVDLELPDAPSGQIVDLAIEQGLPTIVLTGSYDDETRDRILAKKVVDYFLKEDRGMRALNAMLQRLRVNPRVPVLVVDDSSTFRLLTSQLLGIHRFNVHEAEDGEHALEMLEAIPGIRLVITDYEMPKLNGVQLVAKIRDTRARDELAIIGVSSLGSSSMSAMFLKYGADDFLTKPFQKEEFYCRVYRSIETIEHIDAIKRSAYTDQLTSLSNRLYFFHTAPPLYEQACESKEPFAVALLDIDHFKAINDTFGHAGGDVALQHLSQLLITSLPEANVIARFGGEEFCVLALDLDVEAATGVFERLRRAVEQSIVYYEGQTIQFTLSVGVAIHPATSLDTMINRADELLYQAKETGRNRVVVENPTCDA